MDDIPPSLPVNDQVALFTSEVTRVASVNDQQAPAWWTLADAEGNEADVGTGAVARAQTFARETRSSRRSSRC
jgi:hypothetical protein